MADQEPDVVVPEDVGDEEMAEAEGTEAVGDNEPTGLENIEPDVVERTTFLE